MLPELLLKEEEELNLKILVGLSALSGLIGIGIANSFFSQHQSLIAPMLAAVPLVFPLMNYYFAHEENPDFADETLVYGAMFLGLVVAFFASGLVMPEFFDAQMETTGLTGEATASDPQFTEIFSHNITLFGVIIAVSALLGSAGAFILALNASMVGVFFSNLAMEESVLAIVGFLPHTALEMTGFIVAGILGTTISASVYRQHFSFEHWKQLAQLLVVGFAAVFLGAFLETA